MYIYITQTILLYWFAEQQRTCASTSLSAKFKVPSEQKVAKTKRV